MNKTIKIILNILMLIFLYFITISSEVFFFETFLCIKSELMINIITFICAISMFVVYNRVKYEINEED